MCESTLTPSFILSTEIFAYCFILFLFLDFVVCLVFFLFFFFLSLLLVLGGKRGGGVRGRFESFGNDGNLQSTEHAGKGSRSGSDS